MFFFAGLIIKNSPIKKHYRLCNISIHIPKNTESYITIRPGVVSGAAEWSSEGQSPAAQAGPPPVAEPEEQCPAAKVCPASEEMALEGQGSLGSGRDLESMEDQGTPGHGRAQGRVAEGHRSRSRVGIPANGLHAEMCAGEWWRRRWSRVWI